MDSASATTSTPPVSSATSGAAKRSRATIAKKILSRIALIYALWVIAVFFMQRSILYPRSVVNSSLSKTVNGSVRTFELPDPRITPLWIQTEEGDRTESWLYRAPAATEDKGLVVFLHGNAELIDDCFNEAQNWLTRGYAVLIPEYRGYGRSGGTPTQHGIVLDVLESLDLARTKLADPGIPVLIHGRSLGTGVAAQVATRLKDRGELPQRLILESPFLSIARFSWGFGVPGFIVRDSYCTECVIESLTCPILIVSADADEIVPASHGRALADIAPDATYVVLKGSHNSGMSYTPEYWATIDSALAQQPKGP